MRYRDVGRSGCGDWIYLYNIHIKINALRLYIQTRKRYNTIEIVRIDIIAD